MILIRPYKEQDKDFICSSYLNATYFKSMDKSTRLVRKHDHDFAMDRRINDLIAESVVLIACPEDDPDTIVGYLIYVHEILHYIYIKRDFRMMGIANELVKSSGLKDEIFFTHTSKDYLYIIKAFKFATYNPFICS